MIKVPRMTSGNIRIYNSSLAFYMLLPCMTPPNPWIRIFSSRECQLALPNVGAVYDCAPWSSLNFTGKTNWNLVKSGKYVFIKYFLLYIDVISGRISQLLLRNWRWFEYCSWPHMVYKTMALLLSIIVVDVHMLIVITISWEFSVWTYETCFRVFQKLGSGINRNLLTWSPRFWIQSSNWDIHLVKC